MQLLRLHGPRAPLGPDAAVALAGLHSLTHQAPPFLAHRLWDAAAAINCLASSCTSAGGSDETTQDTLATAALQAVKVRCPCKTGGH